jgi:glycosyltransferase involved in cell wall biosynthesis
VAAETPLPRKGLAGVLVRLLKGLNRATLGLLRRVWRAANPDLETMAKIHHVLDPCPVEQLPSLSVVVDIQGRDESEVERFRQALQRQTVGDFQAVFWDRVSGDYVVCSGGGEERRRGCAQRGDELASVCTGQLILTVSSPEALRSPTCIERLQWLAAVEVLDLVRVGPSLPLSLAETVQSDLVLVSRHLWGPRGGLDLDALARRASGRGAPILGKDVNGAGMSRPQLSITVEHAREERPLVRKVGAYYVTTRRLRPPLEHRVRQLQLVSTEEAQSDERPVVVLLMSAGLLGGLELAVADLLRCLSDRYRFVVVLAAGADDLSRRRATALETLTPFVYQLAADFPEQVQPSVVHSLIRRHDAGCLLHVGASSWFRTCVSDLRSQRPNVRIVNVPLGQEADVVSRCRTTEADLVLATSGRRRAMLVDEAGLPGEAVQTLTPGVDCRAIGLQPDGEQRATAIRAELGVPHSCRLVTMIADLVPDKRPEDFVALARRFHDDAGYFFLLVGEGPLAGAVSDFIRLFSLSRCALQPPAHRSIDIVAAADVVCSTSESEPFPVHLLTAVATGKPVVSTTVDACADLLGGGEVPGVMIERVGDLAAFEEGIRRAAEQPMADDRRRQAREMIEERFEGALDIVRRALEPARE